MTARELYQAGRLGEAVQALNAELRENPADTKRRTFLFELLCFAGNYDRAEKQLEILAQDGSNAQMGALLYRGALNAERTRCELFEKGEFAASSEEEESAPAGSWNGRAFSRIEDADPRIGPRLEMFAAGQYLWVRFDHIQSIEMEAPKRLRDLLWMPAMVRTGPAFRGKELGEVLLPVISPLSYREDDDRLKLGRATEWRELASGETAPVGQKMLLIDGEEAPFLELRRLELHPAVPADQHASA
jgi:type VI secretion system protein ImpE